MTLLPVIEKLQAAKHQAPEKHQTSSTIGDFAQWSGDKLTIELLT
jgi:hypothetical protein